MRVSPVARWGCLLVFTFAAGAVDAQPLRRDLSAYCVFGMRRVDLKSATQTAACNIGVNCAQPSTNGNCGVLTFGNAVLAQDSQTAGDITNFTKSGDSVWQVFRNGGSSTANVTIGLPGPQPDGTFPLSPLPILGDLDGDGTPSCQTQNQQCVPDVGDLEAACGFPKPFPACDPAKPIKVPSNGDCSSADTVPGNHRCDLPPGVYGALDVSNDDTIVFTGGDYVFCSVNLGRDVTALASNPAVLRVSGDFAVGNGSAIGQSCGDLDVQLQGPGRFTIGTNSVVVATMCGPERQLFLGRNSDLKGRFVADQVPADFDVTISPCGGVLGGMCTCFDQFSPTVATVGSTITFTGDCDLLQVREIRICGLVAPITQQTVAEVQATVPAGASGPCPVSARSDAGLFTAALPLQVN